MGKKYNLFFAPQLQCVRSVAKYELRWWCHSILLEQQEEVSERKFAIAAKKIGMQNAVWNLFFTVFLKRKKDKK